MSAVAVERLVSPPSKRASRTRSRKHVRPILPRWFVPAWHVRLPSWVKDALPLAQHYTGVLVGSYIGGGTYGRAFLAVDGRRVLKISQDYTEHDAAFVVRRLRRIGVSLPGFVRIHRPPVFVLDDDYRDVHAFVKEVAIDLRTREIDAFREYSRRRILKRLPDGARLVRVPGNRRETIFQHASNCARAWRDTDRRCDIRSLRVEYEAWLRMAATMYPRTRPIVESCLQVVRRTGYLPIDVVPHNFGRVRRNGRLRLACFDFGVVSRRR